ncbi:MAG: DNA topoisomerase I [Crenarchaeota archaeon]|nr:DNA topoisomerase I [Thermoproteota archaeon]MDW8034242.1 DNA topoisomerase I [Nitrososphaerota archaeon]
MPKYLIIAEKPEAARRISEALDSRAKPRKIGKIVPSFIVKNGECEILVTTALGHLYELTTTISDRSIYPVLDYKWVPKHIVEKNKRLEKWLEEMEKIGSSVEYYVNACDYDIEGSLIGYNILRFLYGVSDYGKVFRMKLSTLTKREIQEAFQRMKPGLDIGLVKAGETRHIIDFLYGINLSRALTRSVSRFLRTPYVLSVGRVQTPTLNVLVEREIAIETFIPNPYWILRAEIVINGKIHEALYENGRVQSLPEVKRLVKEADSKLTVVEKVEKRFEKISVPEPFDLTTLQREAYNAFGFTPSRTLSIAETLYLNALISYPRTSSQKLPPDIGDREILEKLSENKAYAKAVEKVLSRGVLEPKQGEKEDPAHPAIYPTGEWKEGLSGDQLKLLDLITRRFLAAFEEDAEKAVCRNVLRIGGVRFILKGSEIIKKGWLEVYSPYYNLNEKIIPSLKEGDVLTVKRVIVEEKFTNPPHRYNPASLIREMEKLGIGTKATRADIVETLYKRRYITGKSIVVTELGFSIVSTLSKFSPNILSVEMTRSVESDMEKIESGLLEGETVVNKAKRELIDILREVGSREGDVGKYLSNSIITILQDKNVIGKCPVCKEGDLKIIVSKKTGKRFGICTNVFNKRCRLTIPLPQNPNKVYVTDDACNSCGWPIVKVVTRNRPWSLCVNPSCSRKTNHPRRPA